MSRDSFNIGNTTIKVKSIFYFLLALSVVCGIIISIVNALNTHDDIFTVLTAVIIFTLCTIGFIAIIIKAAKRWRYVVGIILAGFALYIIFSLPSAYNYESWIFYQSPIMISFQFMASIAWLISGIILIINKNIFTHEKAVPSELSGK
jgi:hypothetical protein